MGSPIQILLVDDNLADIRWVQEALKESKLFIDLHSVLDGEEATEYLWRRGKYASAPRPDLILLDINMPKKDGPTLLAEIKNSPELKKIPVIMLTTSSAPQDVIRSYDNYANGYITKPVGFKEMIKVVSAIEDFWFTIVKLPTKAEAGYS